MAEPFLGEIRMFAGNFAPEGWAFCDGRLLPISENTALFALLGTFYGGDGQTTFALPDLRSRVPNPSKLSFAIASSGGAENVTVLLSQLPAHTHALQVSSDTATQSSPANSAPAASTSVSIYKSATPASALSPAALANARKQPAPPEYSAIHVREPNYRLARDFPVPELKERAMSDPFVAEIRMFPFNFAPQGWALCNGQILPISQNTALFSLLGTNFGGDGKSNFGLPNLQGSVPLFYEQGPGLSPYVIGQVGGSATVTLLQSQLPTHTHPVNALGTPPPANTGTPAAGVALARSSGGAAYAPANDLAAMSPSIVTSAGGNQPHNNLMPYLVVNFCIALQGIFPARN